MAPVAPLVQSQVIVASQPICDASLEVVAHELLFRPAGGDWGSTTAQQATARVLVGALNDIGLYALTGGKLGLINVDREFLLTFDALPFGPESLGIELLEDQLVDEQLLQRIRALKQQGYLLALDDYELRPGDDELIELADVIKLDVRLSGVAGVARQAEKLAGRGVVLLAEKVEDDAEFRACRDVGCTLFQGFFFCRPTLVQGHEIPHASLSALRTSAALARADATFEEMETIVAHDPGLTLRLVRLLNSAAFPTRRPIATVHDALTMLGAQAVRQWATLLSLAEAGAHATPELVHVALTRANALSTLARADGRDPDRAFAVGLFSVADAMLGVCLAEVLADLPLDPDVLDALLKHAGADGAALATLLDLESGGFSDVADSATLIAYADAQRWARATVGDL